MQYKLSKPEGLSKVGLLRHNTQIILPCAWAARFTIYKLNQNIQQIVLFAYLKNAYGGSSLY